MNFIFLLLSILENVFEKFFLAMYTYVSDTSVYKYSIGTKCHRRVGHMSTAVKHESFLKR